MQLVSWFDLLINRFWVIKNYGRILNYELRNYGICDKDELLTKFIFYDKFILVIPSLVILYYHESIIIQIGEHTNYSNDINSRFEI